MPPESAAPPAATSSAGAPPSPDLASQVTQRIEGVVSILRDHTVKPVSTAVRYFTFALMALFVVLLAATLFAVFALRVLDDEVPVFHGRVWASYLVVAGIFSALGLFLSRMRRPRS